MRRLLSHSLWGRARLVWSALSVLSVLCGVTACFVSGVDACANSAEIVEPFALRQSKVGLVRIECLECTLWGHYWFCFRSRCLWCFENHQINCWANSAEIVEPFALRQSKVGLVHIECLECTLWGHCLFCFQSGCLWCFENHQINCWANSAEIVEPFALRQSKVGLVRIECLECTLCGHYWFCCRSGCLWCFENHQINCWANSAEIVEPFALRQSKVGLVRMHCLECEICMPGYWKRRSSIFALVSAKGSSAQPYLESHEARKNLVHYRTVVASWSSITWNYTTATS